MTLEVFYFGDRESPLFGSLLRAQKNPRQEAIVLFYPGPEEYMRMHWPLRGLAHQLSLVGFDVFRFDYWGTGDSSGDTDLANIEVWQRNCESAMEECRDLADPKKVHLLGLRLGASLMLSKLDKFSEIVSVAKVAAWDLPQSSEEYLGSLQSTEFLRAYWSRFPFEERKDEIGEELLGYRIPESRKLQLENLVWKNFESEKSSNSKQVLNSKIFHFGSGAKGWSEHVAVEDSVFQGSTISELVHFFSEENHV